jgi:hypothetical protein
VNQLQGQARPFDRPSGTNPPYYSALPALRTGLLSLCPSGTDWGECGMRIADCGMNQRPPKRGHDRSLLYRRPTNRFISRSPRLWLTAVRDGPGGNADCGTRNEPAERPTGSAINKERLFAEALLAIVCPADAVLAKLPFPSKQGWITVGALLTSNQGLSLNRAQPSLHGIIISGLGHWPGIPNTAGQNTCGRLQKLKRTIRVVLLRDARLATLLVAGARCSLRLG